MSTIRWKVYHNIRQYRFSRRVLPDEQVLYDVYLKGDSSIGNVWRVGKIWMGALHKSGTETLAGTRKEAAENLIALYLGQRKED